MTFANIRRSIAADYDPVTAEVLQMRLYNIVEEMTTTMIRTSGSPVLTEAKDFCTALLDRKLEHVGFSGYVTPHLGSSLVGVRSVLREYAPKEIFPGDHFLCNDPHTSGALHQGDVALISPIFYQDRIVAWAFSNAHVLDIGGMSPGGFAPEAWDCYGEGLRFPAMKIAEDGKLIKDLQRLILHNVRMSAVLNDIKSLMAANIACQRRLTEVLDKIGITEFERYCDINKGLSEGFLRDRIAKLPDGVYETADWVEYDGHGADRLFKVACKMVVDGSDLTFDFSGSDPQSDGFVNAGYGVIAGAVAIQIMLGLTYDIPINGGILRPIKVRIGPPGTVVNPVVPAPVSAGHAHVGAKICRGLGQLLSQAMQFSDDPTLRKRVASFGQTSWAGNAWMGFDESGGYVAFMLMDPNATGLGATAAGDGLDAGGAEGALGTSIPDVETNESLYPMLYLWRKIYTDSAGPGFHRGGHGIDLAWIPWGAETLVGSMLNQCAAVPSNGIVGGYPGATSAFEIIRNSKVAQFFQEGKRMPSLEQLIGERERQRDHAVGVPLLKWHIFRQYMGSAAGLGDPILRDPARVARDVRNGYVSLKMAENAYGVMIDPATGRVDNAATARKRDAIREARLRGKPKARPRQTPDLLPPLALADVAGRKVFICNHCGHHLCGAAENWKTKAVVTENELAPRLATFGVVVKKRNDPPMILREYCCPSCGVLFETKVGIEGQPVSFDIRLGAQETMDAVPI